MFLPSQSAALIAKLITILVNDSYFSVSDYSLTLPSGVLFSTHISSVGGIVGVPGAVTGGIPGGNIIPGGGGMLPIGGGMNGGLCKFT